MSISNPRARLRDLGFQIGQFPTGQNNAITDVPGVLVGQKTVIQDTPFIARSGVTVILPREGRVHEDYPFAGFFSFNGIGEMTGLPLLEEWGVLTTPVVLTNTNQVGLAWDTLTQYGTNMYGGFAYKLPVVAETYDGFLNSGSTFPLTAQDVIEAIKNARSGPVAEGNVGGGTGMICYDFKGGIGTSSRVVEEQGQAYTIGVLVQANHGERHTLRVNGVPVGLELGFDRVPGPYDPAEEQISTRQSSSILVVIATDAPLLPLQCKRLAKRATVGLARTGGLGLNTSGDLFLAFATGNHYPSWSEHPIDLQMLHQSMMDPLIEATAEAVEESILNALTAAETITGYADRTVTALPLEDLVKVMEKYSRK